MGEGDSIGLCFSPKLEGGIPSCLRGGGVPAYKVWIGGCSIQGLTLGGYPIQGLDVPPFCWWGGGRTLGYPHPELDRVPPDQDWMSVNPFSRTAKKYSSPPSKTRWRVLVLTDLVVSGTQCSRTLPELLLYWLLPMVMNVFWLVL